jgi:hypothetical protein
VKDGRIVALNLTEEINKILESKNREFFEEVLNDLIGIESFQVLGFKGGTAETDMKIILVKFPNGVMNQLYQLSDGTIITLSLVTYLFTNKYPVIAIEELENSIHPKLLQKVIRLIKNNFSDVQIIITTHSPILLNMVQLDEVSILLSKECGNSEIVRVSSRLLRRQRNDRLGSSLRSRRARGVRSGCSGAARGAARSSSPREH